MQKITLQLHIVSQSALYGPAWELNYVSISIWGNTLHFKMTCKWAPEPQSPVHFRSLCPGHWGTWVWSPLLVSCTIWPTLEMQAAGTMPLTASPAGEAAVRSKPGYSFDMGTPARKGPAEGHRHICILLLSSEHLLGFLFSFP